MLFHNVHRIGLRRAWTHQSLNLSNARTQYSKRIFSSTSRNRNYHHSRGYFRFLDDIPENTIFWGIIGLNGAIFGLSWWAKQKLTVERDPRLYAMMRKHFYANWHNISSGRIWTLFTSMFTHNDSDVTHILFNGFTFYFMAPLVLQILGSRRFLFLYLGGGALSELFSIAYDQITTGRDRYSVGASGAIYSILSFLAFTEPRMTLLIYGIVPVPIWLAVTGLFSYETYLTAWDKAGTSNSSGHVGGILSGAGYFFLRRFRIL